MEPITKVGLDETSPSNLDEEHLASTWKMDLRVAVCERCDWSYLVPKASLAQRCPHCFQAQLSPVSAQLKHLPYVRPPEMILPFSLSPSVLEQAILGFAKGIPFAPADLSSPNLKKRLSQVYLPVWLVDAEVKAFWKAEAGFDYQVVSHQEQFSENRGGWNTQEITRNRIRWEPRLGKLDRVYNNVPAPALEDRDNLTSAIGAYGHANLQPYQPEAIEKAFVRLPNRAPEDAWNDARPAFQSAGAEECRQAAAADHIRQFFWQPEYAHQNWTLLLLPLLTTF